MITLPDQLKRSLTWDQGKEMAEHVRFSIESGVSVYFCDPRSPWQRGTRSSSSIVLSAPTEPVETAPETSLPETGVEPLNASSGDPKSWTPDLRVYRAAQPPLWKCSMIFGRWPVCERGVTAPPIS